VSSTCTTASAPSGIGPEKKYNQDVKSESTFRKKRSDA
jgi:hypothetical protein